MSNPSLLERFSKHKKNNILKALIAFSKFHGFYLEFKDKVKAYGIKWSQSSSVDSFFRILNNQNNDVLQWYRTATKVLDNDSSTCLKFTLLSGIRRTEAINSFNLLIRLHRNNRLSEYYNEGIIEHFRYRDLFLRNTKNVFISIIPRELIIEVVEHNNVTYDMIRKKLYRRHIPTRINELRDFYGTFMVRHGLIREEVDLLQGRVGKSTFVKHYWSPALKELKSRVFNALKELETLLS